MNDERAQRRAQPSYMALRHGRKIPSLTNSCWQPCVARRPIGVWACIRARGLSPPGFSRAAFAAERNSGEGLECAWPIVSMQDLQKRVGGCDYAAFSNILLINRCFRSGRERVVAGFLIVGLLGILASTQSIAREMAASPASLFTMDQRFR